ncbi:MAG: 4-hydroxy-3-methylbut-2-enyl diphosphate reductase [Acidobacteria bacterium]|nr:4-hydroxy-3-methylbut-2-enyl diphosphate reductase [Acidobacteriota bacterium]
MNRNPTQDLAAGVGDRARPKTIVLLKPRGFCAGVVRAIDIVNIALECYGKPVYVRKEIVHNSQVVAELSCKGAIFVDSLEEVPEGAWVIFSAHGVSPKVREQAVWRRLRVIDATCPLVTKVHLEAVRFARLGYSIILIGHKDHDEVIGTFGEAPHQTWLVSSVEEVAHLSVPDPSRVACLTQTTLSLDDTAEIVEALKAKFPQIISPPAQDICYATQNRQVAVKAAAPRCDLLLVVGSANSSNSNRLVEVATNVGLPAHLIEDEKDIAPEWLEPARTVGVTAGASAPEYLVSQVIRFLEGQGYDHIQEIETVSEDVRFALPPELIPLETSNTRKSAGL